MQSYLLFLISIYYTKKRKEIFYEVTSLGGRRRKCNADTCYIINSLQRKRSVFYSFYPAARAAARTISTIDGSMNALAYRSGYSGSSTGVGRPGGTYENPTRRIPNQLGGRLTRRTPINRPWQTTCLSFERTLPAVVVVQYVQRYTYISGA